MICDTVRMGDAWGVYTIWSKCTMEKVGGCFAET